MNRFVAVMTGFIFTVSMLLLAPVVAKAADVTYSGFVDASYFDAENVNSSFTLDEVELDINAKIDDRLSLRADLNYREVDAGGGLTADEILEQGYITYKTDLGEHTLDITFGKFNAPIGFELLDPVDMYQYSHSLLFNFAIPTNLTGVMGFIKPSEQIDLSVYYVNGWDVNSDNNNHKTIGARVGLTPNEDVNIGLSLIRGAELAVGGDVRTVIDLDFTLTTVEKLIIGGEFNIGEEENTGIGGDDAEWMGLMVMANYEIDDENSVTFRFDTLDDEGGTRIGVPGVDVEVTSVTFAALRSLDENAGVLFELRMDDADVNIFDGGTEDSQTSFALEFTYSF